MKDNGYYKIEDSPEGGKIITLFHGCIVDFDILVKEIIGSTLIQHQDIEIEKPKDIGIKRDNRIKVNKTTSIEIKTIQKNRIRNKYYG